MSFMETMEFKKKLEILVGRTGVKAADVARRAGVPPQRITDWKDPSKHRQPTIAQALSLARALGVSVDYLLDDAQDDPPPPLTEDERTLLRIARKIGIEEALSRLSLAPGTVARPLGGTDMDPSDRKPSRQHKRAKGPDVPAAGK
jgi:transcriptional regulator with XRE-family HTH domain